MKSLSAVCAVALMFEARLWASGRSTPDPTPTLAGLEAAANGRTEQMMDGGRTQAGIAPIAGAPRAATVPGAAMAVVNAAPAGRSAAGVGADFSADVADEELYTGIGASAGSGLGIAALVLALALNASPGVILSITWLAIPSLALIGAGIGHWLAKKKHRNKK